MNFRGLEQKDAKPVAELFLSVFSASEGDEEGRVICHLASELCSRIDDVDVHGFAAVYEASIVGAIFFSRLTFKVPVEVFVLSPVAVATAEQGAGVGQALITLAYARPRFFNKGSTAGSRPRNLR
jgi:putative acetyltransferase